MRAGSVAFNIMPRRTKLFSSWNFFSALTLLPEEQSLGMVKRVLEGFGINVYSAGSVMEADQFLRNTRLDVVLCDFDVPHAAQLALLQPSTHWRGVCVGLMPSARLDQSSHKRVQLRLPKPVSVDMLVRSLKASYTSMARQRIANYRHNVPVRVAAGTLNHRGRQHTLHQVNVLNLSQTGLCLHAAEPLPHGASLTMSLVLPDGSSSLHASGNVVWSHASGRSGIAFERSECPEMKRLQQRLNAWLPRELGIVARLA